MDAKLTLKLDQTVIEQAKDFAREKGTSLSRLIENYLQSLTNEKRQNPEITPLVKSLSGILDSKLLDDADKDYRDYLTDKYK